MFQGLCHGDAVPWEWGGHQEGLVGDQDLETGHVYLLHS